MPQIECLLDSRAMLGECPRWSTREQCLYWVDIAARSLNRYDPTNGQTRSRIFDQPVGCFAVRRRGGFVLGQRDRFALIDDFDAAPRSIPVSLPVDDRFNDGRCDSHGRFWAGTMDGTKSRSSGALYRLDPDLSVHRLAEGALTGNGLAFSPDERTLYWSDTPRHIIRTYAYDAAEGRLGPASPFFTFPQGQGRPDGAAVDRDGQYWSALYDGHRVVRFSPAGVLVDEVEIPARHCTMIAFGGTDYRTAFVTTARQNLTEKDLQRWPQSGGLFSFAVDIPGLPEREFAG